MTSRREAAPRREGGRHGRPAVKSAPALPETHIRPQLLRLAVLPPVAVALSACAAVLFLVRSTGVRPGPALWGVLGGAVCVALAGIVIAAVAADRAARTVHDRIGTLRRSTARREGELRALVETLRRGDGPPPRPRHAGLPRDADDFDLLATDLARAHDGAVTAVVQASRLSSQAGSEQKLEVFVNLARRLQSLVHREISILDELENEIEDPDLLKGLFHVDHLATRIRRHAENLAVLGGAVSRRQWSNPVSMTEVLRSAIAEVEQYSRVKLVPPVDGTLRGHAVADVIHLLAELVENATVFSAPHTQVLLRANLVTSGLAVEVEDRGLGMPVGEQDRMNALLSDPDQVNVASLLADGRIGLFVVSQLAKRHGIHVRLQTNIYGGVQAVLVVPQALLGAEPGAPAGAAVGAVGQPREGDTGAGTDSGTGPQRVVTAPGAPLSPVAAPAVPQWQRQPTAPRPSVTREPASARVPAPTPAHGSAASSPTASASAAASTSTSATAPSSDGGAIAPPLPVRGARQVRPTPAEAVPGISADDRQLLAENDTKPLTPRTGTVRGTMGKPQLPRRRAQEHIAPQLREGPAPRQDTEHVPGHDPNLMAAFQRGISLAESQQHMESHQLVERDHMQTGPVETGHMEPQPMERGSNGTRHTEPGHTEPHAMERGHIGPDHMGREHMSPVPMPDRTPLPAGDTARTDHTARHDGSASAG
ncbi:ATP-binding protein [Streptomyces sp. 15-116A]|uniref:sensor histidine kinase n=1 Tax=Streptomyces sp. 15-116A TaxID=2259035 RepID=UPI0021B4D1C5|nr:ATP-binding protein [Streptomyces sp. 15-116A]MCT7351529.1 ATP-binding protein [Streptomyces sp. 15-116A]